MDQRKLHDTQKRGLGIEAIVLVGGLGTRLQGTVRDIPKALAPVRGKPFLDFVVENLMRYGVSNIILSIGHRAEQIIKYVHGAHPEWPVEFSREDMPLGTGGALKKSLAMCRGEHVLALNGDSLAIADLKVFFDFHIGHDGIASIMVSPIAEAASYGRITAASNGRISQFEEKPKKALGGVVSAGVYIFRRDVEHHFPPGEVFSLEKEFLPNLLHQGCFAYTADAFLDIGTPERYANAEKWISEKESNQKHQA